MMKVHENKGSMEANVNRRLGGGGSSAVAKFGKGGTGPSSGFVSAGDIFRKDQKFELKKN